MQEIKLKKVCNRIELTWSKDKLIEKLSKHPLETLMLLDEVIKEAKEKKLNI